MLLLFFKRAGSLFPPASCLLAAARCKRRMHAAQHTSMRVCQRKKAVALKASLVIALLIHTRCRCCHCRTTMAAASTGEQVHAVVKLLSEKSVADVQQGARLLREFLQEHGSSGRSELLQWGVVHSVMTLLTEVRYCAHACPPPCSNCYRRFQAFPTELKAVGAWRFSVPTITPAPSPPIFMWSPPSSCTCSSTALWQAWSACELHVPRCVAATLVRCTHAFQASWRTHCCSSSCG